MNRGAARDGGVRVQVFVDVRLLTGQFFEHRRDLRHQRRTADEDDRVEVGEGQVGRLNDVFGRVGGALQEVVSQVLEEFARNRNAERLAFVADGNRRVFAVGQHNLRDVAVVAKNLHRFRELVQVDVVFFEEFFANVVGEAVVPVDAAELDVAVGRDDVEGVRRVFDDRRVERSAAEVVDENAVRFGVVGATQVVAVPSVGEGGRSRFVDDADDVQSGDAPGVLRRFAARVVEVRGDRDDGVRDRAQAAFAVLLQLAENQRRNEFRRNVMTVEGAVVADAHLTLNPFDDVFRVFHRGATAVRADDDVFAFREKNDTCGFDLVVFVRNRRRFAFVVDDRQRRESRA